MLVDSHCHLNYKPLNEDIGSVVTRAKNAGVGRMVTIATTMREYGEVRDVASTYEAVYCSIGVHPNHTHEDGETVLAADIVNLAGDPKTVAIGETGLDYYYKYATPQRQQESFREHIRAAITTGLPIVIHSREAEEDTARLLKEERAGQGDKLTGVLHCFSSRRILAEEALAIGFYVSFSGIITFKKSEELRSIARDVPLDRLLVETDSPYLAPEPFRGKPCEPAYVVNTARMLAEVKGVSPEVIAQQTTDNFFRLFKKVPLPT